MENKEIAKKTTASVGERFTEVVMREFASNVGSVNLSDAQKRLVQGYFMGCDRSIRLAETDRATKNDRMSDDKYKNMLPYSWNNVIIDDALAQDIVANARLGLDVTIPNHLSPVLYKDNKLGKYRFSFIRGFRGREIVAKKYGLDQFQDVRIEIIYSTDKFVPIKKDNKHDHDDYEFEITNPFDRGEIIGGFGYVVYPDPKNNILQILTLEDIEKRRPDKASPFFWGGSRKSKDKKTGEWTEEKIAGWYKEMVWKTIANYVYSRIPLDPTKTDDSYQHLLSSEMRSAEMAANAEIENFANKETIDVEVSEDTPQIAESSTVMTQTVKMASVQQEEKVPAPKQEAAAQPGPGF